ncbi:alpha/beta fold hydrolase [Aquimarina aggregata]|uniref:alpha/beta fold hydrolase n=1 Tax=Aquimarina aggregata TaxID=1642818 RepID=UPI0024908548|nr:alpha/beta fold hydrolase [Aquimarina aggregata]
MGKGNTLKLIQISPIIVALLCSVSCSGISQSNAGHSFAEHLNLNKKETISGRFKVPENHNDPKGEQIDLAYVIMKSRTALGNDYPLIYLTGGPGGKTLTKGVVEKFTNSTFRDNRDIILFDQRGVGFSSPLPNMNKEIFEIMSSNLTVDEEYNEMSKLLVTTKQEIESSGRILSSYNTFQNAKDVGFLMNELGYKKYNIMGGSYGTTLGRVIQDLFPEKLNSVIHNAPSPLKMDFLVSRLHSYQIALERLFLWCGEDSNCSSDYPELKSTYVNAIKNLKEHPIVVNMGANTFTINAQDGLYLIRRLLYVTNSKQLIPRVINALKTKDANLLKRLIQLEKRYNEKMNFSMHLAVSSYEQIESYASKSYIDSTYISLDLFPTRLGFFEAFYQSGKDWQEQKISDNDKLFKPSNVPTLITVNYYDPVTPPENGYLYKKDLSNAELLVLNEGGHGGVSNPECRDKVFKAFMDNPEVILDTSCLNLYIN